MSDYLPIDCGLHSELELLAMHGQRIEVDLHRPEPIRVSGLARDVQTRDGAEWLELESAGEPLSLRLDQIHRLHVPDSGLSIEFD